MGRYQDATARQLDFESDIARVSTELEGTEPPFPARRPVPLCVVCGRQPARLTVARDQGHAPAKLCLRCHHSVLQQRKMLRVQLPAERERPGPASRRSHHLPGDAGLIVPRGKRLSVEARNAALNHRRRRAQVAARRALQLLDCFD